jgi:poly(hydroxyalkanoate) depolymerase family esterase
MDEDFATALSRSLAQTRAGNPMEATRLIQAALGARSGAGASAPPSQNTTVQGETVRPHRRLSEVLAGLARRPSGLDLPKGRRRHIVEVPEGADFARRRHECGHGARDYRLYVPSSRSEGVQGLILMLHGCTQSPEDFAVGTGMNAAAERNRMMVVYPEQERTHNASLCWNWFRPGDQGPSAGEAALLASLAASVVAEHGLPPERVYAAGLSAGGAMAAILAHRRPDVFRAAGVHSGLAPGSAQDVVSAFAAMRGDPAPAAEALRAPAIIFHGSADTTVAPVNAGRIAGQLDETGRRAGQARGRSFDVLTGRNAAGHPVEVWRIDGGGHTWSGGRPEGSHTDPAGPDASAEMVRFFLSL